MELRILGLHIDGAQTSAALLQDGRVVAGVAEERLNREKSSGAHPVRAARWCLEQVGWLDAVAVSGDVDAAASLAALVAPATPPAIHRVEPHLAQLALAMWHSPFDDAAMMLAEDGVGSSHLAWATMRDGALKIVQQAPAPSALGRLYAACTELLGMRPNADEWKVMGAAAYGDGTRLVPQLRELIHLDVRALRLELMLDQTRSTAALADHLRVPRPSRELEPIHFDLAAACQQVFEECLFEVLRELHARTGLSDLALAGSSFMNSLANGKVLEYTPFQRLFIPFAPGQSGRSIGAALWLHRHMGGPPQRCAAHAPSARVGPAFTDDQIEAVLKAQRLAYQRVDDPVAITVQALLEGRVVGWFQGAMEFGDRALGARSILADPRDAGMKDRINCAVKFREAYRPFAPSVLAHRAQDWFLLPSGTQVPYMERVARFRDDKRTLVPAVVHHDGTGRLQTVRQDEQPLYFALISAFEAATGVPMLLNTSFNVQGEPIVCSPADALRTFFASGLDLLVMGRCLVRKPPR